ncbi:MAG: DNA polymerase III subunit delta [Hyphomicrobiales bacterium]
MKFEQIVRDIKDKSYAPVYFLTGDEPYYIDMLAEKFENDILDDMEKEFNMTVLYGRDTSISQIIGEARRFPMMANHHIVIVKEAQDIPNFPPREKKSQSKKGSDEDLIYSYLSSPLESTILVFLYKHKKLDSRTSLGRMLTKYGVYYESKKLYDNQVPGWIKNYVESKGRKISDKPCLVLSEYLGSDLSKVSNELDKIIISLPKGQSVSEEIIERNVGISKDFNVFELQNAISRKDIYKANLICRYFAENPKQNPLLKTLPSLFSFFVKVMIYKELSHLGNNELASELGVHPYFLSEYKLASTNYSLPKLSKIIEHLRIYDLKAKGVDNASINDGELLKELLFKILH